MKHILKIDKKYWNLIDRGIKKYEVRKLNKNYIKDNDTIYFISLDEKVLYGKRKVISFMELRTSTVLAKWNEIDEETIKYVATNYWNEEELLVLRIEEEL